MEPRQNLTILFTSVGRRVELVQQFKAAATAENVRLEVIGADISESAPALAFCDRTVIVPRISDRGYIPALLEICGKYRVDCLIPTIDTDLYLLSCEKERFAQIGTTVLISRPEKIAICRDKRRTSAYFQSLGLHAPEPVDDVEKYCGGFPAFIKPLDGSSSIGANRADTMEQLRFFASQLSSYVVQPFAAGTEYTVDIFCDLQGEPVYITPRIRQAVRAGEVLKTKICHNPQIEEEMRRLIADFRPCGAITVQLIRDDAAGVNQYIEINPRFGGGAPLSMKAGADAAAALLRLLLGQQLRYVPCAAQNGAVYSRFDQSICVGGEAAQPVKAVIFDLDDTLYPEKEYVKSGYRKVASVIPQVENAEQKLWAAFLEGKPAIDHVLAQEGLLTPEIKQLCLKAYREQQPDIQLYAGAAELLSRLREAGIKIGIITDGRPEGQRAKVAALGLAEMVDSILITDELGGTQFRKPNDLSFRVMQHRLGVHFASMVYVGDNAAKDFHAPRQLGMRWIFFRNNDGLYTKGAMSEPVEVSSVEELKLVLCDMI